MVFMEKNLDFSWFKLEKYNKTKSFSLGEWYIQLSRRIVFKTIDSDFVMAYFKNEAYQLPNPSEAEIECLHIKEKAEASWADIKSDPIVLGGFQFKHNAIREATFSDLCIERFGGMQEFFEPDKIINPEGYVESHKKLKDYIETSSNHDAHLRSNLDEHPLLYGDFKYDNALLLAVNFDAPEASLIEEFKRFVKDQQKEDKRKYKRKFTDQEISKWTMLKVLPCIDLLIFSELIGKKIPIKKMEELLFPRDYDMVEGRVKRAIIPLAEKLLTPKVILDMESELPESFFESLM